MSSECGVPNCQTCSSDDTKKCSECNASFELQDDHTCLAVVTSSECGFGEEKNGDGVCVQKWWRKYWWVGAGISGVVLLFVIVLILYFVMKKKKE
jgi:hypothetical protein